MLKGSYLKALTSRLQIKSARLGREVEGSTPPSVFVGSWNYPYVFAGPMIAPFHGDTAMLDTPECWIPQQKTTEEILQYRMSLVRGKERVKITDVGNRFVEKLQEIALAKGPVESEARFRHEPRGFSLSDDFLPHGPSAIIEEFFAGNAQWDKRFEKVYYDGDLKAADAVVGLYNSGAQFSQIQKALSVGGVGMGKNRRLVPTRWAITACDSILANHYLEEIRHLPLIDDYRVLEFSSLNNYYAIILLPTPWQYEWMEAFLHVLGSEEVVFADYETNKGKKGYSSVGGCYYSCKFAIAEGLARMGRQAGAIVFREAYNGYVPLGVFNVRENVRQAMRQEATCFDSLRQSLAYVAGKLRLPFSRFIERSALLRELLGGHQTKLI